MSGQLGAVFSLFWPRSALVQRLTDAIFIFNHTLLFHLTGVLKMHAIIRKLLICLLKLTRCSMCVCVSALLDRTYRPVLQITLTDTLSFYYLSFDIRVFTWTRLEVFGPLYFFISVNFFMSFFQAFLKACHKKGRCLTVFCQVWLGWFYSMDLNLISLDLIDLWAKLRKVS